MIVSACEKTNGGPALRALRKLELTPLFDEFSEFDVHDCRNLDALELFSDRGYDWENVNEDGFTVLGSILYDTKPDSVHLLNYLLVKGASLENALRCGEKKYVCCEKVLCLKSRRLLDALDVRQYLPQIDFRRNFVVLRELGHVVPDDLVEEMKKENEEITLSQYFRSQKLYGTIYRRKEAQYAVGFLAAMFALGMIDLPAQNIRGFLQCSKDVKMNMRTIPYLSKELKEQVLFVIMCIRRIGQENNFRVGKDILLIVLDKIYSSV